MGRRPQDACVNRAMARASAHGARAGSARNLGPPQGQTSRTEAASAGRGRTEMAALWARTALLAPHEPVHDPHVARRTRGPSLRSQARGTSDPPGPERCLPAESSARDAGLQEPRPDPLPQRHTHGLLSGRALAACRARAQVVGTQTQALSAMVCGAHAGGRAPGRRRGARLVGGADPAPPARSTMARPLARARLPPALRPGVCAQWTRLAARLQGLQFFVSEEEIRCHGEPVSMSEFRFLALSEK